MKKFTAYLLILLLLLNVMGYYGIFIGLKNSHTAQMTQRIDDSDFSESQTVTLKVPITLPYYGDTQFERVNGEIEYNGEFYRLVKQKYEQDTLYIVCIRDVQSKRIKQALADYVKQFSEHSSDSLKTAPAFIKDFISCTFAVLPSNFGWSSHIQFGLTEQQVKEVVLSNISPPPEA